MIRIYYKYFNFETFSQRFNLSIIAYLVFYVVIH